MFVLIHSPLVGPLTWQPVAAELRAAGHQVVLPSLLSVATADPPFWPAVVDLVCSAVPAAGPLVLVPHSNAGLFVPLIREALGDREVATVFVDGRLPAASGSTSMARPGFLGHLRGLAGPDGRLPRWTEWWGDADLSPLFPDPGTRAAVVEDQPRLPLAYFEQQVPVPAGWDHPCAYLRFSAAYDGEAADAAGRGWPVADLPGQHLHQIVDPAGTAETLQSLSERVG